MGQGSAEIWSARCRYLDHFVLSESIMTEILHALTRRGRGGIIFIDPRLSITSHYKNVYSFDFSNLIDRLYPQTKQLPTRKLGSILYNV